MGNKINCPTCFKTIPNDRIFDQMTVCECGQVINFKNNAPQDGNNTRAITILLIMTMLILGGFIHVANWDRHSASIIPLKVKQLLGVAKLNEQVKIAEICKERKKYFCQEQALISAHQLNPKDAQLLLEIGQLQMNREAYNHVVKTYSIYFNAKGKDKAARLNFAKALQSTGQLKEAKRHLKYLVFSDRRRLQAEAARTYVNLLMKTGNLSEAHKVIRHCRGVGSNASLFMDKELKEVRKKLRNG